MKENKNKEGFMSLDDETISAASGGFVGKTKEKEFVVYSDEDGRMLAYGVHTKKDAERIDKDLNKKKK